MSAIGPSIFGRRAYQEQAEYQPQACGDQHRRPIGFAVPVLQRAAFDADDRLDRMTFAGIGKADEIREIAARLRRERANLGPGAQLQQDFTVRAQFGRHDVEQAGVDAEDRDQRVLVIDIPEHRKRRAVDLVDPEQQDAPVPRTQHVRPLGPSIVELQRLGVGRADHRSVAIDQADILDHGALIDLKANGL
jgi:hypothetical protein